MHSKLFWALVVILVVTYLICEIIDNNRYD